MKSKGMSSKRGLSREPEKRKKLLVNIVIMVILLSVFLIFMIEVAGDRSDIKSRKEHLLILQEEERLLNLENEQLKNYLKEDNIDAYIERHARDDMGYANLREQVFYIVPDEN